MSTPVNFQLNGVDFDDVFVRSDIFSEGGLWVWGPNVFGGLGDNTTTDKSSPVQTVSGGTNWKQVSTGSRFSAAIKTDGTLWLWGSNIQGQLGTNNTTDRSSPVQTISTGNNWKQVSCGGEHTFAIKTDGSLWGWGQNEISAGQLGDNTVVRKSSPVQTVAGGTNWKQVSCGASFTAAIKTDGTLWLWGGNGNGQLGTNNTTRRSSPVQTVSGGTDWKFVSCGSGQTFAIKTDGSLWGWGQNTNGQLGNNDSTSRSSPVQTVSAGTNWKLISCGTYYTAAIKTDGTLWLWGQNYIGQLGTNDRTNRSSPVQTVSAGTNWKQVSCGAYVTAAIKTDSTLWMWGDNGVGQLGTNDLTHRSSPVQTVSGGTNWKLVSCSSGGLITDPATLTVVTDYWN